MSSSTPSTSNNRTIAVAAALVPLAIIAGVWLYQWWRGPDLTIGVEGQRFVEIRGPQLQAAPFTPGDAVSLRVAEVVPTARGFRYDLRFILYGPGEQDLAEHLVAADGSRVAELPKLPVSVDALLPKNHKGELFASPASEADLHSNYSLTMRLLWAAWGLSLVPLLVYGHRRRKERVVEPPPPTIEERLRGLLERASHGTLSIAEQVDLERLLAAYWSERLQVSGERWGDVLDELRRDAKADNQLGRVERWLHARSAPTNGVVAREILEQLGSRGAK